MLQRPLLREIFLKNSSRIFGYAAPEVAYPLSAYMIKEALSR